MAIPFKVLIIGGGVAGLTLAIMLEAYGFDYELLEKHSDVAPKLGAGVGLTPNGARILDQIGVWEMMCERSSPVDSGTALSPEGRTVIFNPNMGEWLQKLFGYKIHFLSRHDCLKILFNKIQQKSRVHLLKEVIKIEAGNLGEKGYVETKDGSIYTGDIIIGADGVRSSVRRELWRIADSESPGYIPKQDKTGIVSFYTAVVGIAYNSGLPEGGSARAYNHHRSYFFQEGREGSGEFYWWLCAKNEKTKEGVIPKLSSEVKEGLLNKYKNDQIGPDLTLGALYKSSIYSTVIPLQEFVLQKCFYKNILLIGDTFRKLHPVAGQGANSAIEESAFVADMLWDLRERGALHDPDSIQKALTEFQTERVVRTTALREDANLVQRMESLDNPVMKFMALKFIPRLNFVIAFLPQLGSSFTPARHLKHLRPPKVGLCPFSQDMKAKPLPRSPLATFSWVTVLILAASSPWLASKYFISGARSFTDDQASQLAEVLELYISILSVSISGMWVIESYKTSSLISPFTSSLPWILASNFWGWQKILPIYICFYILSSQSVVYYYMPQTMTDLGVAKALLPALLVVYTVSAVCTINESGGNTDNSWWFTADFAFPVVAYLSGMFLNATSTMPQAVDVVFSTIDIPYQRRFQNTIAFVGFVAYAALASQYGTTILNEGLNLLNIPAVKNLASLTTVTTLWCLYSAWELRRINATGTSVIRAWLTILSSTIFGGPAATLAGTFIWSKVELAKATSFHPTMQSTDTL
uniref:FAD-dependent monooxygenase ntnA n=1 Tax=Nectria sp. TaxID=1755444 RepID=NTNA_NECSZ|nr:RecName: Full=FAD-dependent monooxygenase ntnA; AltName: Full=Nectripenoid biosynthesis cluster protein A [Nectria sp. (in: ascomycete fungi)]AYO60864.1 FAD-dependent monooxygenase NtnA [Nectria sp. (in: ascomycete fungi)]